MEKYSSKIYFEFGNFIIYRIMSICTQKTEKKLGTEYINNCSIHPFHFQDHWTKFLPDSCYTSSHYCCPTNGKFQRGVLHEKLFSCIIITSRDDSVIRKSYLMSARTRI